jgi:hypothetical protein
LSSAHLASIILNTINLQTILYKTIDMAMNWSTGFRRVFLLATVGWVIFASVQMLWLDRHWRERGMSDRIDACEKQRDEEMKSIVVLSSPRYDEAYERVDHEWSACLKVATDAPVGSLRERFQTWTAGLILVAGLAVPPAVAYGVFLAIAWAVRGFRTPSP